MNNISNINTFVYTNQITTTDQISRLYILLKDFHSCGKKIRSVQFLVNQHDKNHNYLQIPVLFRFSPIIGPIELFAEIGPAAAIHLSSSAELANTTVTFNDNANNWDFSAIAGLGVGLKFENILLEIEGRYDYGFTNLSDTNGVEVKSRAIQALAGITFLI